MILDGAVLVPGGHVAVSGDILVVTAGRGGGVWGLLLASSG